MRFFFLTLLITLSLHSFSQDTSLVGHYTMQCKQIKCYPALPDSFFVAVFDSLGNCNFTNEIETYLKDDDRTGVFRFLPDAMYFAGFYYPVHGNLYFIKPNE